MFLYLEFFAHRLRSYAATVTIKPCMILVSKMTGSFAQYTYGTSSPLNHLCIREVIMLSFTFPYTSDK